VTGRASQDVVHVTVCIATYRRPLGLRALIESLNALEFVTILAEVSLVIVDNDPANPAVSDPAELSRLSRWPVSYHLEHTRGIVAARNRALDAAYERTDFIVFVDDDEAVVPCWLEALIRTQIDTGANAVQGPMVPRYESPPPAWVPQLKIFDIGPFEQGERLNFAATGNSLVEGRFLRDNGLRFDHRFNTSGGEDEEFYGRLRDAGGVIRAAADAVAYDDVPTARMTLPWVLRRSFRKGNTLGRVALLRRRHRILRFLKGGGAILRGASLFLGGCLVSEPMRIRGLMEVCRGSGMLAAFANFRFSEYSAAIVAKDRGAGV
jgi:succinoglycan biosynthesis protein ExoM